MFNNSTVLSSLQTVSKEWPGLGAESRRKVNKMKWNGIKYLNVGFVQDFYEYQVYSRVLFNDLLNNLKRSNNHCDICSLWKQIKIEAWRVYLVWPLQTVHIYKT